MIVQFWNTLERW